MRIKRPLFLAACTALLVACSPTDSDTGIKVIGVTLLSQSQEFYKELEEGLRAAAAEEGFRLIVQSAEFDPTIQTRQLEDFVTRRVDAIIVCPCDSDTVSASLRAAEAANIPIFTADIAARGALVVTHVASDNYQGGEEAAKTLAHLLDDRGQVLIIDHPTVSSVQDRTRGFEDEMARHPDIELIGKPSGNGQRSRAQAVMEDALTANPELAGVFGINDDSALGALRAVEAAGREDVIIIGYDATAEACAAIQRGSPLRADVIQYPRKIGAVTIGVIASYFRGDPVPEQLPVKVGIVDKAVLDRRP